LEPIEEEIDDLWEAINNSGDSGGGNEGGSDIDNEDVTNL
jgi:hypothetical protein